jgi:hypothetical protein
VTDPADPIDRAAGGHQLAEVNVARLRLPLDHPDMAKFVRALDDVNWLADQSPGFVWRHRADPALVTYGRLEGEGAVVVTLSVWEDFESLLIFVRRTAHGLFMRQRHRWFVPMSRFTTALWWVPAGTQPSVPEALGRLEQLRADGPRPDAFSLSRQFDPDGAPVR